MTYKINYQMVGDDDSADALAREMAKYLRAKGYDVEYTSDAGLINSGECPLDDWEWQRALDEVYENMQKQAAAILGRKGGQSRSEAKIKAVRENGKLGGRPRNNWSVVNYKGDVAGHDMSRTRAEILASELRDKEPDAEWEAIGGE